MPVRNAILVVAVLVVSAGVLPAQTDLVRSARELERRGRYEDAIRAYREMLEGEPASYQALMGLERIYTRLGRLDSIVPYLAAAEQAAPRSEFVRELQIRVWGSQEREDSVEAVVTRWMRAAPDSATPYRQWAFWLAQRGKTGRALAVLQEGQTRLGDMALAREVAEVLGYAEDWTGSTDAWRRAVQLDETLIAAAVASLREAPEYVRAGMLGLLDAGDAPTTDRRLAADLLLTWGRAEEGWTRLDSALPADREAAIVLLAQFAERARQVRTLGGARARGYALERLARLAGGAEAERARLEAAQAFADAGDIPAAQRMLGGLSLNPRARRQDAGATMGALIRVLADAGRADEAEDLYRQWSKSLRPEDEALVREKLAWARVVQGQLNRAERLIANDSSIGAQAVKGWIALYRGDLANAAGYFRAAGPYAQSREEATQRTQVLALIQRIVPDTVPKLGEALQRLVRGDTVRALDELAVAARRLPAQGGRPAVLAFAGEVAVAAAEYARAEELLLDAIALDAKGPSAPAAEYALAVSYARVGRNADAVRLLENLILNHAESAIVPQARRLLDQMKGMVPSS